MTGFIRRALRGLAFAILLAAQHVQVVDAVRAGQHRQ